MEFESRKHQSVKDLVVPFTTVMYFNSREDLLVLLVNNPRRNGEKGDGDFPERVGKQEYQE